MFDILDFKLENTTKRMAEKKRKMKVENTKIPSKTSSRANPDFNKRPKTKQRLDEEQKKTISEKSFEESYQSLEQEKDVEMDFEDQIVPKSPTSK